MQHKSIYFPIRQSGYVGKCMNYFNSLNCPETSLRASERGGRGWAVLSACSRDRNHSYSFSCPEIWEMGVPARRSFGGKQWYVTPVPQHAELRARPEQRARSHPAAEQRPLAGAPPCLAGQLPPWLGHCRLTLAKGDSPSEAQRLCLTLTSRLWAHNTGQSSELPLC